MPVTLETEILTALKKTPVRTEPIYNYDDGASDVRHLAPGKTIEVIKDLVVTRSGIHFPIEERWRCEASTFFWVLESVGMTGETYLYSAEEMQEQTPAGPSTKLPSFFKS